MSWWARVGEFKGKFIDLVFPPRCVGCGKDGAFICSPCCGTIARLTPPLCPMCSKPLLQEDYCPSCRRLRLEIDGIRSPFVFQGMVRRAIHQFKYRNFRALALPLSQLLAQYLETKPLPGDVLVPVPLHSRRLRERGYNQSGLLSRELGKLLGLPVVEDSLVRLRDTRAQARTPDAEERLGNVLGAFSCRNESLKGRRVLLVDDVCTTGATLNSCAIALKGAGASSVWGLALAREA